jgi:hypothetical protein
MILISHRGNMYGPNPKYENTIEYIDAAIAKSFLCEIDVWKIQDEFFLSHDYPDNKFPVDYSIFETRKENLIVHCKNIDALCFFNKTKLHYFWHQNDSYTLTSYNWIWANLNKPTLNNGISICVLPEQSNQEIVNFSGICSDYILKYKNNTISL